MNITAIRGFRGVLLAAVASIAPQLAGAATATCDAVCGRWQLEQATAPDIEAAVDAALARYKGPRRPPRERAPQTLEGADQARMERALGPIDDRLPRDALRADLLRSLRTPGQLEIEQRGADVLIGAPPAPPRRYSPGVSHARVDADGTATIECTLTASRLTVAERYDRRHRSSETYTVDKSRGLLKVTREVRRPGLKPVRIEAHYRRVEAFGLQSPES